MKRKKALELDAINHSNKLCHPAHDDEHQQQATALQRQQQQDSNTQSSSSRNAHDRYAQIHTRTSCSRVQYNCNISGSGTLLLNHTHGAYKKKVKQEQKQRQAFRESNPRPHTLKECKLLSNHPLSYMITCHNYMYLQGLRMGTGIRLLRYHIGRQ